VADRQEALRAGCARPHAAPLIHAASAALSRTLRALIISSGATSTSRSVLSVDMYKGRLEAFRDAVIAIILTVMVLELRQPAHGQLSDLRERLPVFLIYLLSFVNLAIYWNNHHHMLQAVEKVDGAVLWANMHLMFWLSLFPFVSEWLGTSGVLSVPVATYGVVLMFAGIAYYILERTLIRANGDDSRVAKALGSDLKGQISVVFYALGVGLAFVWPAVSCGLYAAVACMWFIPDRRFEHKHKHKG
jgi:uncharacterized membrane protein